LPFSPITRFPSIERPRPIPLPALRARRLHAGERLVEIDEDVVDVFDADAQPDHLRPHAGLCELGRRHLPVRGRGRMAGQ
jgi:hypothetical protein